MVRRYLATFYVSFSTDLGIPTFVTGHLLTIYYNDCLFGDSSTLTSK